MSCHVTSVLTTLLCSSCMGAVVRSDARRGRASSRLLLAALAAVCLLVGAAAPSLFADDAPPASSPPAPLAPAHQAFAPRGHAPHAAPRPTFARDLAADGIPPHLVAPPLPLDPARPAYSPDELAAMPLFSAADGPVLPSVVPARVLTSGGRDVVVLGLRPDLAPPLAARDRTGAAGGPPPLPDDEVAAMTGALLDGLPGDDPDGPTPWDDPRWAGRLAAWSDATGHWCTMEPLAAAARTPSGQRAMEEARRRGNELAAAERAARAARGEAPLPPYVVRVAYLIPSDREPQPIEHLQHGLLKVQWFYRDQMERHGFGPKTFLYETEPDGLTPKVHVIHIPYTAAQAQQSPVWYRDVLTDIGVPWFADGQVWLGFIQKQRLMPTGQVGDTGHKALHVAWTGETNPGFVSGAAAIGGDLTFWMAPELDGDDRPYHGVILPWVGPYELVYGATYGPTPGQTLNDLHWFAITIAAHELGHAFTLHHTNDESLITSVVSLDVSHVMGSGGTPRGGGMSGNAHSLRYPTRNRHVSLGDAAILNASRWFNPFREYEDNEAPAVAFYKPNSCADDQFPPIRLGVMASDPSGLAAACGLVWPSSVKLALPISGPSMDFTWAVTTNYANIFTVYDIHGNLRNVSAIPSSMHDNCGPWEFSGCRMILLVLPYSAFAGAPLAIDPTNWYRSSDDAPRPEFVVYYDLDNDGLDDIGPFPEEVLEVSFPDVHIARIVGRFVDPALGHLTSPQVPVRIVPPPETAWLTR